MSKIKCERCKDQGYYYLPLSAFENNRYFCECEVGRKRQTRILRKRSLLRGGRLLLEWIIGILLTWGFLYLLLGGKA